MKHETSPGFYAGAKARDISNAQSGSLSSWLSRIPRMFAVVVVVPTVLASIYYLLIASPLYVSEAQFVLQQKDTPQTATGLGSMLASVGVSAGEQEIQAYEVQNYMGSRNAIEDLVRTHGLMSVVGRPEGDFLFRFPRPLEEANIENLYKAYGRFVTVDYDLQTGISTLKVKAFRPQDARNLAAALLDRGEDWVNRLNDRSLADAVTQAQNQVSDAEGRVVASQTALTRYRNSERLIDPEKSSVADLELIGKLESEIASLKAERAGLAASAPKSPQLPVFDKRIAAYAAQVEAERNRTAGEADSLAPKLATYERLLLDRQLAGKTLETAVAELESARLDARRQQLFLQRVVNPTVPDKAQEPRRLLTIFVVLISSLAVYAILSLVIGGLREHSQK
jgi:capsular polysaccharide transport system permease protein